MTEKNAERPSMRTKPKRKNSQIQHAPRKRNLLHLQRKMQKTLQKEQRQIHKITRTFSHAQLKVCF